MDINFKSSPFMIHPFFEMSGVAIHAVSAVLINLN